MIRKWRASHYLSDNSRLEEAIFSFGRSESKLERTSLWLRWIPQVSYSFMVCYDYSWPRKGVLIQTPWSSNVVLQEIIYEVHTYINTFYGVRAETRDSNGWPLKSDHLLWVYDKEQELHLWQEAIQQPRSVDVDLDDAVKVIGHYESDTGEVFYALKWSNYSCPTWELEEDLSRHNNIITQYCLNLTR